MIIFTFYGNATIVSWILFGAGFRHIMTWTVWAFIIWAPISVHVTRWKNRKIVEKAGTGNIPTKSSAESVTICSSCGAEIKPR